MGICSSTDATSVASSKLILLDGQLQEFPYPVKVSCLLQKYPSSFICNSDDMEFEDFVTALDEDEELQVGHLYFLLPLSKLRYPLQADEMAALAVKASLALMKHGYGGGLHGADPMVSLNYDGKTRRRNGGDTCCSVGGVVKKKRSTSNCRGSGRKFATNLTAIAE
ncbi:hypothetical protein IFM89_000071 [Coptis chinensis]|uniref:Uncharacterized protein n=1 Tax=Coptis chinensis TaxID=261450 RepID=A0A835M6D6_9MAGN|nr:hypothetical protein IFM89_000071 [Coptis chinensis]